MTTQGKNLEELGRRAVACKHWRWMPGMLHGIEAMDETLYVSRFSEFSIYADDDGRIPILSDPATLGCLLHLVREAWPDEWHKHVVPMWDGRDGWAVGCIGSGHKLTLLATPDGRIVGLGNSEASALVAALEAAP